MAVPLAVLAAALVLGVALYLLTFIFRALAQAVTVIPVVGGPLSAAINAAEGAASAILRGAYLAVERALLEFVYGLWRSLGFVVDRFSAFSVNLGEWLTWLVTRGIPALIRAGSGELLRLASWAYDGFRWAYRELAALRAWALEQARFLLSELYRLAVWPLRELTGVLLPWLVARVEWLAGAALRLVWQGLEAAGYRIGQTEAWVAGEGAWVAREVADKLNPVTAFAWVLAEAWKRVPHELRLFLEWLWSLLVDGAELLSTLVDAGKWGRLDLDSAERVLGEIAGFGEQIEAAVRDEAGL